MLKSKTSSCADEGSYDESMDKNAIDIAHFRLRCRRNERCARQKNKRNKTEFTLQLMERNINGQAQAVLMLCQKHNCMNPLRDSDGSEFYFQDHAEAYNTFTQKNGIGSKVKFALLGIAAVTGTAGIILLIRAGLISRKLDKYFPIVDANGNKVSSKIFKNKNVDSNSAKYYVSRGDGTLSDEEVKNLSEQRDCGLLELELREYQSARSHG